jgi:kynurenine---oxoglutarate transaminase / cysteine-S-conjugate beta-lyase / glutamine---phenylpyruvate transaminase
MMECHSRRHRPFVRTTICSSSFYLYHVRNALELRILLIFVLPVAAVAFTSFPLSLATPMTSKVLFQFPRTTLQSRKLFRNRYWFQSSATRSLASVNEQETTTTLSTRLVGLDAPTVWQEFSPLAVQHKAVNLGQGFPDWEPPQFVLDHMIAAISPQSSPGGRSANQYARSYAHLPLAQALAELYSQRWQRPIDPETQIATATGCTNVLFCALQGLINPGDEVILLEPAFDIYSSQVKMAGGIPVYVPLRPKHGEGDNSKSDRSASEVFTLDMAELEAAITSKTKVLLLNSPHNPTGKMFSFSELQSIATIVKKHPALTVISDEVYEHILFDPVNEPHISIAASLLPEQTLTLSSAGKTFSATGWKVGWAVGPPRLVQAVTAVQQWVNFSAATPNQDAMGMSLRQAEQPYSPDPTHPEVVFTNYYEYLAAEYKRKRGLLIDALHEAGMVPIIPPGGFFIMADTSSIDFPYAEQYAHLKTAAMPCSPMPRDWALSRWLTVEVGVTAIPPSAFYSPPNIPLAQNMLRFAFSKSDATLLEAQKRFAAYFGAKR